MDPGYPGVKKKKKKAFKKAIETSVYIKNGKKIKGIFFFYNGSSEGKLEQQTLKKKRARYLGILTLFYLYMPTLYSWIYIFKSKNKPKRKEKFMEE